MDVTSDQVFEDAENGVDTVLSGVSWLLGNNLENLVLTGVALVNATGNSLSNLLSGNLGLNLLAGGLGDDTYVVGLGDTVKSLLA